MLYIEKEGLTDDINRKIIEIRKSAEWKEIKEDDTEAIRRVFDTDFPKNEVKEILLHEQHGICAYCMRRIHMDSHSSIKIGKETSYISRLGKRFKSLLTPFQVKCHK